jgi:hypothetical protein
MIWAFFLIAVWYFFLYFGLSSDELDPDLIGDIIGELSFGVGSTDVPFSLSLLGES